MDSNPSHCYCKVQDIDEETPKLTCMKCRRHFHIGWFIFVLLINIIDFSLKDITLWQLSFIFFLIKFGKTEKDTRYSYYTIMV